jgi:hypothetical protein
MLTEIHDEEIINNNVLIKFVSLDDDNFSPENNDKKNYIKNKQIIHNVKYLFPVKDDIIQYKLKTNNDIFEIKNIISTNSIEFEDKKYTFSGFICLLKKGSIANYGFKLYKENRCIDISFKPDKIFGNKASPPSQRLFGKFHLNNFIATNTKDDFKMKTALKELFIDKLHKESKNFIELSKSLKYKKEDNKNKEILKEFFGKEVD